MGLFKKKNKKKTEIIDLSELSKIEEEKNKKYLESKTSLLNDNTSKKEYSDSEIDFKCIELNEKAETIDFNTIVKKQKEIRIDFETILHEYYLCKIFSRVALKDNEFNAQLIEIDKYVNTIKRKMYNIERMIDAYRRDITLDINDIYESVVSLQVYERNIKSRFLEINDSYYGHIKMSTLSVCLNKDDEGLERFYESIHNFLSKYKDLTEAAEDIYYSSGDFLVDIVRKIVICIKESRRRDLIEKYTFSYFLESDVIITLDIKEWINLFNKIRFSMKLIQDVEMDKYLIIKEKYDYLEVIYSILMMRHEIASGQGKSI